MADKKYRSLKIENIVASGVIADSIDLVDVSSKIKTANSIQSDFPEQSTASKNQRSHH